MALPGIPLDVRQKAPRHGNYVCHDDNVMASRVDMVVVPSMNLYEDRMKCHNWEPVFKEPVATIFPSLCRVIELILSEPEPMGFVNLPPFPNVLSKEPFVLYRASAK